MKWHKARNTLQETLGLNYRKAGKAPSLDLWGILRSSHEQKELRQLGIRMARREIKLKKTHVFDKMLDHMMPFVGVHYQHNQVVID